MLCKNVGNWFTLGLNNKAQTKPFMLSENPISFDTTPLWGSHSGPSDFFTCPEPRRRVEV